MDNGNGRGSRGRSRQAKINTAIAVGVAALIIAAFFLLVFFGVKAIVSSTRKANAETSGSESVTDKESTENDGTYVPKETEKNVSTEKQPPVINVEENYQYISYAKSQNVGKLILVNDDYPVFRSASEESMFNAESELLQPIYDSATKKLVQLYSTELKIRGRDMKKQLTAMLTAINEDLKSYLEENKLALFIGTANRTYEAQEGLYNRDAAYSAPGCSDYNTGYSFSLAVREDKVTYSVDNYPQIADWVLDHAAEYGFIVRYPDGKALITGVDDEPWHIRYVGIPHAYYMAENNLCLEEYIALLHRYTPEKGVLSYAVKGVLYRVYYVAAEGDYENSIPIPNGTGKNDYDISGTNDGGFVVTVKD